MTIAFNGVDYNVAVDSQGWNALGSDGSSFFGSGDPVDELPACLSPASTSEEYILGLTYDVKEWSTGYWEAVSELGDEYKGTGDRERRIAAELDAERGDMLRKEAKENLL